MFALSDAASSQPVKYLGYDLLNRYGMIHKFKVSALVINQLLLSEIVPCVLFDYYKECITDFTEKLKYTIYLH